MSRAAIAAILSFLIPGAGLFYLRRPGKAVINFCAAVIVSVIALYTAHEYVHYVLLAVAAGSAGYAHATGQVS